jgi:hypothetical protein
MLALKLVITLGMLLAECDGSTSHLDLPRPSGRPGVGTPRTPTAACLAMGVKVILTPPGIIISVAMLYTK